MTRFAVFKLSLNAILPFAALSRFHVFIYQNCCFTTPPTIARNVERAHGDN